MATGAELPGLRSQHRPHTGTTRVLFSERNRGSIGHGLPRAPRGRCSPAPPGQPGAHRPRGTPQHPRHPHPHSPPPGTLSQPRRGAGRQPAGGSRWHVPPRSRPCPRSRAASLPPQLPGGDAPVGRAGGRVRRSAYRVVDPPHEDAEQRVAGPEQLHFLRHEVLFLGLGFTRHDGHDAAGGRHGAAGGGGRGGREKEGGRAVQGLLSAAAPRAGGRRRAGSRGTPRASRPACRCRALKWPRSRATAPPLCPPPPRREPPPATHRAPPRPAPAAGAGTAAEFRFLPRTAHAPPAPRARACAAAARKPASGRRPRAGRAAGASGGGRGGCEGALGREGVAVAPLADGRGSFGGESRLSARPFLPPAPLLTLLLASRPSGKQNPPSS